MIFKAILKKSKGAYISIRHISSNVEPWWELDRFVDLNTPEVATKLVIVRSLEPLQLDGENIGSLVYSEPLQGLNLLLTTKREIHHVTCSNRSYRVLAPLKLREIMTSDSPEQNASIFYEL